MEDLGVQKRKVLKRAFKKEDGNMDYIYMADDRYR
jgi:hypothetical protein